MLISLIFTYMRLLSHCLVSVNVMTIGAATSCLASTHFLLFKGNL